MSTECGVAATAARTLLLSLPRRAGDSVSGRCVMPPGAVSKLCLRLAVGLCLLVIAGSGLRLAQLLADARGHALDEAADTVAGVTAPILNASAARSDAGAAITRLLQDPTLGLTYVTIVDTQGATRLSRGSSVPGFDWLPAAQARQWRAFMLRVLSAEGRRQLMMSGRRQAGSLRLGVAWQRVAARAGTPLLSWIMLLAATLAGVYALLRRLRPAAATVRVAARPRGRSADAPQADPKRRTEHKRPRSGSRDFAPIAAVSASDRVATRDRETDGGGPPAVEPVYSIARRDPESYSAPEGDARTSEAPVAMARSQPACVSERADDAEIRAPRDRDELPLGDDTLAIRFYPIWRDSMRQVPAGAWATLAWRTGEGGLVEAETLTQLAARDGTLRGFTEWLAHRLCLLQGNWRTLELDTVPIVLPVTTAMLGFADAHAVWQQALKRADSDSNDLILRPDPSASAESQAVLPVRRALGVGAPDADPPPDCDVLCLVPPKPAGRLDAWQKYIDAAARPVLLGPVDDPSEWAALIEHPHVSWYSDAAEALYSPRSFARLLIRYGADPV